MFSRGNILVVDDEVNLCRILGAKLTRSGYEVMTVHDGLQAVEKVRERQFDLVLLDLVLPELDGLSALTRIRRIDSRIPVIVMTASSNTEMVDRAISEGATALVSKPFDLDRLVKLVKTSSSASRSAKTILDGPADSSIFLPGIVVTVEPLKRSLDCVNGSLEHRNEQVIAVRLQSASTTSQIRSGDPVKVRIAASGALYRFASVVQDTLPGDCITLEIPQVICRIQRRRYPRIHVDAPVTLHLPEGSQTFTGRTEDINPTAVSIISSEHVEPGTTILVDADVLTSGRGLKWSGEVLRCSRIDESADSPYRIILQFSQPIPELKRDLQLTSSTIN